MSEESPAPVSEGDVLANKYRVEKVLGVGGMGVVVAAMHLQLDRRVALKFLLPTMLHNGHVVQRFEREARAAARIKSEHVARVIDVGELEGGSPYMVMEFLEGEDLAEVLSKRGPLPVDDAIAFVLQACDAIAEAHSAGIVHRDLKPANLFLARRPDKTSIVKVLDFGISKMAPTGPEAQLTQTQALIGSPYYMSPEQMVAPKTVDSRSDIWALGVIMFELLTGRTPFLGESLPELVAGILHTAAPAITESRPDAPAPLAAAIARCLEKERDARYRSIAELGAALAPFVPPQWAHLPPRISRVLGHDFVPVAAPQEAIAPAAPSSTLLLPPAEGPPPIPEQSAGTISRSSWGAASSSDDAPPPPARPSPTRLAIAIASLALLTAGAAGIWRALPAREPPSPRSSGASASTAEATPPSGAATAIVPEASSLVIVPLTAVVVDASTVSVGADASATTLGGATAIARPRGGANAKPGALAARAPEPVAPAAPTPPTPQPPPEPSNKMKMEWK